MNKTLKVPLLLCIPATTDISFECTAFLLNTSHINVLFTVSVSLYQY
jgi:hypothetical protein